jgi:predicted nucleotidyltransferase component of viral defense system
MDDLLALFPDVADALNIESVAIVEKDYYIVELLRLLQPLNFESHQLVFSGGTALCKAGISLNRMSEDVDIKLVPCADFFYRHSRSKRRTIRKLVIKKIADSIVATEIFTFDTQNPKSTRDEYRYSEIPVRYPQRYVQTPCLRPFIRLELIETVLLEDCVHRDIVSLVTGISGQGESINAFPCATIVSTQAEKIISILRRTAAIKRNVTREDDALLIRHVYDNFCIVREVGKNTPTLRKFIMECIKQDIERYGNQHLEFCTSPIEELKLGLYELGRNPIYRERYQKFVAPMVFGQVQIGWDEAYTCLLETALDAFES